MLKTNEISLTSRGMNNDASNAQQSILVFQEEPTQFLNTKFNKPKIEKNDCFLNDQFEKTTAIKDSANLKEFVGLINTNFFDDKSTAMAKIDQNNIKSKSSSNVKSDRGDVKNHDIMLASTSSLTGIDGDIKLENNDEIDEGVVLNTEIDFISPPFFQDVNSAESEDETDSKLIISERLPDNDNQEKTDERTDSGLEESIQIETTQNKIFCGTSCCSQSSTHSSASTTVNSLTKTEEGILSLNATESEQFLSDEADKVENYTTNKEVAMNLNEALLSKVDFLATKLGDNNDSELNANLISELLKNSLENVTKRRKVHTPQKAHGNINTHALSKKVNADYTTGQLRQNDSRKKVLPTYDYNPVSSMISNNEGLNTQFSQMDISMQAASTFFDAFNQLFYTPNGLQQHQTVDCNNTEKLAALSLSLASDPASAIALINAATNSGNADNTTTKASGLINEVSGVLNGVQQDDLEIANNNSELLKLYDSILQLAAKSSNTVDVDNAKLTSCEQLLFAEALGQLMNTSESCSTSDQQQLHQQSPNFDPATLLLPKFASLWPAMALQNNLNVNDNEKEKNFLKENFSLLKDENNFGLLKDKLLSNNEKKQIRATLKSKNLKKFSTLSSAGKSPSTSDCHSTPIAVSSVGLSCSPSSSVLSSPTSASSFTSAHQMSLNTPLINQFNILGNVVRQNDKPPTNVTPENSTIVAKAVLEALMHPVSAPAVLNMLSNDQNVQNVLFEYLLMANGGTTTIPDVVSPTTPTFSNEMISTPNVTEEMLTAALNNALRSAHGDSDFTLGKGLNKNSSNWSPHSDFSSNLPSWFAPLISSSPNTINNSTGMGQAKKMTTNANKISAKYSENDRINRQENRNENLPLDFGSNLIIKSSSGTPTVASVLEERRRKRPRTTSKSNYISTGSSPALKTVLAATSAIKNVSNALQAANLNGATLNTGPTTVSAVVNISRAAGYSGAEFLELSELEEFANSFKKQRIKHGFTQGDVGVALGKRYGTDFSQTTISRFEALNLSYKNMCKLRPLLKEWLEEVEQMIENGATVIDILEAPSPALLHNSCSSSEANQNEWSETDEKNRNSSNSNFNSLTTSRCIGNSMIPPLKRRRKRTNLDNAQKASLDVYFKANCRPDHQRMNEIAATLELDSDVVRVWFCNRRQKFRKVC